MPSRIKQADAIPLFSGFLFTEYLTELLADSENWTEKVGDTYRKETSRG